MMGLLTSGIIIDILGAILTPDKKGFGIAMGIKVVVLGLILNDYIKAEKIKRKGVWNMALSFFSAS